MRKKVMAAVLTAAMVASVSAMPQMVAAADDEFKIGLITDVGGVNDGSFNQSAWEGLEKAGEELGERLTIWSLLQMQIISQIWKLS